MSKPRKLKFGSAEYKRLALDEMLYAVDLSPCGDCGAPVVEGYCCTRCGSSTPESGIEPDATRQLFPN
jgi:hypothetical protein